MKVKNGFTLAELIIVVAILAIISAIVIPVVGGNIRRATVSADATNAREMTSAVGRWATEYSSYVSKVNGDINIADSSDDPVYKRVVGVLNASGVVLTGSDTRGALKAFETANLNVTTKYPKSMQVLKTVLQTYIKPNSSVLISYTPKTSGKAFWYANEIGAVVVDDKNKNNSTLCNDYFKTSSSETAMSLTWVTLN